MAKGGCGVVGETTTQETEGNEAIERLLVMVRRELDAEVRERSAKFDAYADSVYRKVLAEYRLEQQRGTWTTRAGRWLTNMAAAIWNSRAVRLLVP